MAERDSTLTTFALARPPVAVDVVVRSRVDVPLGVDAVVAEGCEAGGHIVETTTMVLVPHVCDATDLPVLAAGGIGDGRGIAAAFQLGAVGVQVGTRFLVAEECGVHPNYKKKVLNH